MVGKSLPRYIDFEVPQFNVYGTLPSRRGILPSRRGPYLPNVGPYPPTMEPLIR